MRGWLGGAKVLGKLPVTGPPTNLDYSRARAYCACIRCRWGFLDIFSLIYHFSFLSPSPWETARYRLKYCLKGPLSPQQPTTQNGQNSMEFWPYWVQKVILRIQSVEGKDEVAHYEPPHQDLSCLQIFSSLVLKELKQNHSRENKIPSVTLTIPTIESCW